MTWWNRGYWADLAGRWFARGYWPEVGSGSEKLAVEQAILAWARGAFGFEVLWLDQDEPRLPTPYATLKWFGDRQIGIDYRENIGLALEVLEQVQELRQLTVELEVYTGPAADAATPEALELLEGALLTLQADPVTKGFRDAEVSFLNHEAMLRLDEFSGDRWERRAHCDLHFLHVVAPTAESIGMIETADPTVTILE